MSLLSKILESLKPLDRERHAMKIQALIFSKDKFGADAVKTWAAANNFHGAELIESRKEFRMVQKSSRFTKMRTIELTPGVKAIIGKIAPTRSGVHVNAPMGDQEKLQKDKLVRPDKTAGQLHREMMDSHENIGGTIKRSKGSEKAPIGSAGGSAEEKFVFGPMTFDIDKAREMSAGKANSSAAVSADWSHRINVDEKAALKATNQEPVIIGQLPTTNGAQKLLLDGHHRMFKALSDGKNELPAYTMSPEETMSIMETHPDLMKKMQAALPQTSKDPANGKVTKDTNENQDEKPEPSRGETGDNELAGLYDMQQIVTGMDWELEHNTTDTDLAHEMALSNLQDDPEHYRKLSLMDDGVDWSSSMGQKQGQDGTQHGLKLDIGSGENRAKGFLGLDLQKHDHGTLVHDVHMGLPFPDGSASHIQMKDSLHEMDQLSKDPKPILSEIQRVLMPGGQFVYEGPDQIQNQPEWLKETWNEKFQDAQERGSEAAGKSVAKIEGNPKFRQEFARLATPDAATSNDAEPRIGINQYDSLPADALLAMDSLGYYWSDSTSSGRGNRLHGYPSQGALVKGLADAALQEACDKGGPGSGPSADKDREKNEHALDRLKRQSEGDKKRYEAAKKSFPAQIQICKADDEKQVVYGVVLAPNEMDLQQDWMRPEEIEKTAHFFMMNGQTIGREHEKKSACVPVESYIAPVDIQYDGQYGNQIVKKGSWVLGVKVVDPQDWAKVKSGEYTGFSVGGWGQRKESDGPASE